MLFQEQIANIAHQHTVEYMLENVYNVSCSFEYILIVSLHCERDEANEQKTNYRDGLKASIFRMHAFKIKWTSNKSIFSTKFQCTADIDEKTKKNKAEEHH